jgi:hypothetical protein
MQQVLSQSISVFASPSLPEGNGIFIVPGGTSGATKTAPLDQHLEGVHHLFLGSAQIEEGRASVLRERLLASLALEKLRALLAVTPVADDIPFPLLSIVGALFIRTAKLARIHHGRHPPWRVVYYDTTDSIIMLEGHHQLF